MDPSALDRVSRSFESCLDWWGWFILVSTAIVALGLVIEYWEPVKDLIDEWRRPAAAFPWKKFIGLAGGILVTVGVFGEFWGAYKASRVETKLRDNNHKIEGLLDDEASANKREAEKLRKDAEELKAENLKLRAFVNPRHLTIAQQRAITQNCSTFKNVLKGRRVKLVSYWLNTEALILSEEVVTALRMRPCEMDIDDDAMLIGPTNDFVFGIVVFGSDSELAKKIADAIGNNGGPIGAGFMGRDPTAGAMHFGFQNSSTHEVTILVGIKPDENTKELIRTTPAMKPTNP